MKIEALIFDLGNVVIRFDWQTAEGRLRARSGSGTSSPREDMKGLISRFEVGEISQEMFVSMAAAAIGFQGDEQEFIAIFNSIFSRNPSMERSIQQLAGRFPIYLLSNTSELHLSYLKQNLPCCIALRTVCILFMRNAQSPTERYLRLLLNNLQ